MQWVILNLEALLLPSTATHESDWSRRRPDPAALTAASRLSRAGHHLVLISAGQDNATGKLDSKELCTLHARINEAMTPMGGRVDAALYCPHGGDESCDCRTPSPGLLTSLGERLGIGLHTTPVASPLAQDLQAAASVGALPVYIGAAGSAELPPATQSSPTLSAWVADYLGELQA